MLAAAAPSSPPSPSIITSTPAATMSINPVVGSANSSPSLTTTTTASTSTQRQSLLSNRSSTPASSPSPAISFQTAPLISPTPSSAFASRPGHTSLTPSFTSSYSPTIRDSATSSELNANAIHAITATATVQEAHILRVMGDNMIHVEPGSLIKPTPTILSRGTPSPNLNQDPNTTTTTTTITAHIGAGPSPINFINTPSGPPPPSPPASEAELELDTAHGTLEASPTPSATTPSTPAVVGLASLTAASSPALLQATHKTIPTPSLPSQHQTSAIAGSPNVIPTSLQSPSISPAVPHIDTNIDNHAATSVIGGAMTASPAADSRSIIFEEPEAMSDHASFTSQSIRTAPNTGSIGQPSSPHHRQQPSSSSTTSSQVLQGPRTPSIRLAPEPMPPKAPISADGYLQPPAPGSSMRPARRNTTGSNPRSVNPSSSRQHQRLISGMSMIGGRSSQIKPFALDDAELAAATSLTTGELATDIELAAEQIRRERMEKRAKAEAEAAAFKDQQEQYLQMQEKEKERKKENKVVVGNVIEEGHVNYVLMYNMLTGIRVGVSRCQAKIRRDLTEEDFHARHKFSFDIIGNELTPSAKYDFKFKDYAPWVFRVLREDHFHLDPADYLLSLTEKYILSELGSPGKSGSFFYFSRDYRFIIKTIRHAEHKFLFSILPRYYEHVKANPHTLLSRFYGLHRVKLPRGKKIHFVIMNNLFPPHKDIHETYDLKGSTVGREYSEEKAKQLDMKGVVLKDLNWINRGKMLELGPEKRALLTEQLRRDAEFLKAINVMDYSLLVGIHNMQRGNRDNVRKNTLKVFQPNLPAPTRAPTLSGHHKSVGAKSPEAIAMRRAMRASDLKKLGKNTVRLPDADTGERQHFLFYQDEGGLRATDENNEPTATIYYLGVIDILTPYGCAKKAEHFWKGMSADRHKISPVPPEEYGNRFFDFMKAVMRGGGGGARFKPDYKAEKGKERAVEGQAPDQELQEKAEQQQPQIQQQPVQLIQGQEMKEVTHIQVQNGVVLPAVSVVEPGAS